MLSRRLLLFVALFFYGSLATADPVLMTPAEIEAYIAEKLQRNEKVLRLNEKNVGDQGAQVIARSPLMLQVSSLVIYKGSIGDEGVRALAESPMLKNLKELHLENNDITDAGVKHIANSKNFSGLQALNLYRNNLRNPASLAYSDALPSLIVLNLNFNHIEDEGVISLLTSPKRANLETIELAYNDLGEEGKKAFERFQWTRKFKTMFKAGTLGNLEKNYIGDAGLSVFLELPYLNELKELNLNDNDLTDEALIQLARSPKLNKVVSLSLARNRITDKGAAALAESRNLKSLRSLDLNFNGIGNAGAKAIAESSVFMELESLRLGQNKVGSEGAKALATSKFLTKLASPVFGYY